MSLFPLTYHPFRRLSGHITAFLQLKFPGGLRLPLDQSNGADPPEGVFIWVAGHTNEGHSE